MESNEQSSTNQPETLNLQSEVWPRGFDLERFAFPFCLNFDLIFEKSEMSSNIPVTNILHQTTFPIPTTLRGQQGGTISKIFKDLTKQKICFSFGTIAKEHSYF